MCLKSIGFSNNIESGIIFLVTKSHVAHISWNSCKVGTPNGVFDIAEAGDRSSWKLNGGRSRSQREKPESGSVQRLNGRRLVSVKRRYASPSVNCTNRHLSACFAGYTLMKIYLIRYFDVHKFIRKERKIDL
jgi:hypothetical protein